MLAERLGDLWRGDDRGRGAVRHAAAVEQAERRGDHRRVQDGLHLDRLLQMRLGILGAVLMALPRDVADRLLEVLARDRSEEHTSELQSQFHLVCRLLLEKKKNKINHIRLHTTLVY